MKHFEKFSEYYYLLDDFNLIPNENYLLDKVYDKQWFINDLDKIIDDYENHRSEHTLFKQLCLWSSFLHGVKTGRYK